MKAASPDHAPDHAQELARQLHPSNWLGDDVGGRIASLVRQTTEFRSELVRLSGELATTLRDAEAARAAVIQRICGSDGKSPVRQVVSDRLALMTIGPLLDLWRAIGEDIEATNSLGFYSSSDVRRSVIAPASPSDPA